MPSQRGYFYLEQFLHQFFFHGGIGCVDAEQVLHDRKFIPVIFPAANDFSAGGKWKRLVFLIKTAISAKGGSVIVFLFPCYARMEKWLLYLLSRRKNITIICFIADINGLKDGNDKLLKKEIKELNRYRYFIVHGLPMQEWITANVKGSACSTIEFFDFLTYPVQPSHELSKEIVFAGNLAKSSFLEQLHLLPGLQFNIYGEGKTEAMLHQKNATWYGVKKPYELPSILKGSFGLLWDGNAIDKPGGSLGDYMRYISHHKLSLYILSKLPLIVPAIAGSAYLVEKYKIGFTVNNLYEIEDKINNLSPDEYRQMQLNMEPLADKISKGRCLGGALDEILDFGF